MGRICTSSSIRTSAKVDEVDKSSLQKIHNQNKAHFCRNTWCISKKMQRNHGGNFTQDAAGSFHLVCSFTVGPGVSPGQPLARVADFTASGEFHPALKTSVHLFLFLLYTTLPKLQERLHKTSVLFLLTFRPVSVTMKKTGKEDALYDV